MEETKKQNQSDKQLAELVLIKPFSYLFFKPLEKFLQFWRVKYTINPNYEIGSSIPDRKLYFILDKKTIKRPILFYPLSISISFFSMSIMFIYYAVLFTLPIFLLSATNQLLNFSWTDFGKIATIFVYIYYFILGYLILLKTWIWILTFAVILGVLGFIIWMVFFPPSFSPPSLSDQMGIVILLLVFIAIGVYSRI